MFFILFEATPRRDSHILPQVAGALVSCWIQRATLEEAIDVAKTNILAEGWIIDEPDEAYEVDENTYPSGKEGCEYFEQALIDQEVFVFHCFPEIEDAADD